MNSAHKHSMVLYIFVITVHTKQEQLLKHCREDLMLTSLHVLTPRTTSWLKREKKTDFPISAEMIELQYVLKEKRIARLTEHYMVSVLRLYSFK